MRLPKADTAPTQGGSLQRRASETGLSRTEGEGQQQARKT